MPFVMGGISAGGSLLSGIFGKSAAENAAQIQADAAQKAGAQVVSTTAQANPQIGAAADKAAAGVAGAAGTAAGNALTAGTYANALLNPFAAAGSKAATTLAADLPDLTAAPTMAQLQIDPGFQFRLEQGEKALANSAAARGGALSGGAVKDLTTYGQGMASQEYQAAFNRYQQSRQQAYGILSGTAGMGMSAASQMGQEGIQTSEFGGQLETNAAQYGGTAEMNAANTEAANTINASSAFGNYLTQAGNARAAGEVGGANALSAGIVGAGNTMMNAYNMKSMLNRMPVKV